MTLRPFVLIFILAACRSADLMTPTDGGSAEPGAIWCMATSCTGGSVCCMPDGCIEDSPNVRCGTVLRCDGPEDCPSGTCCLELRDAVSESRCAVRDSCEPMSLQTMCHGDDDCPSVRPHCCDAGLGGPGACAVGCH